MYIFKRQDEYQITKSKQYIRKLHKHIQATGNDKYNTILS